jgi:hypothetical protein
MENDYGVSLGGSGLTDLLPGQMAPEGKTPYEILLEKSQSNPRSFIARLPRPTKVAETMIKAIATNGI